MCVKVDRHTKTKKTSFTNLEIFHVREKNIPVEVVEVKDTVIAFAWEPKGERFATVMTADVINPERGLVGLRTNINFYMLEKATKTAVINNFKLIRKSPPPTNLDRELIIGSIDKKQLNTIFWSPKGRFLAFANLGRGITQFDFEIYDCDYEGENKEMNKELNSNVMAINIGESYGTTDVEWDPTGRFIATSSSFWKHTVPTPPRTPLIISWKTATKSATSRVPSSMNNTSNVSNRSPGVLVHRPSSRGTNNVK